MGRTWKPQTDANGRTPITVRVNADMRAALEGESTRLKCSLSAVAELWLERALLMQQVRQEQRAARWP